MGFVPGGLRCLLVFAFCPSSRVFRDQAGCLLGKLTFLPLPINVILLLNDGTDLGFGGGYILRFIFGQSVF